jgi:KUP system potassium uptake protein
MLLVLFFKSSSALAGAYGFSVAGTMIISTPLVAIVMLWRWGWPRYLVALIAGPLFLIDLTFMCANSVKIPDGGWFPLLIAAICFACLSSWRLGRQLVNQELKHRSMDLSQLISTCGDNPRIRGNAVVLTGNAAKVPLALLHNIEHNRALHECIIVVTVATEHVPTMAKRERLELQRLADGFYALVIHCGFMEFPNIPRALVRCADMGLPLNLTNTSFFLRRSTIIPTRKPTMAKWRKHLFALMSRNAVNAAEFYHLPSNRVVELGVRIEI